MRYCPKCRSTFTNDELNFCLQDGMQLLTLTDESGLQNLNTNYSTDAKTLQMSQLKTEELIDEETHEHKSRNTQEPFYQQPQTRKGGNIILTLGVIVIALCLVALVGIGVVFIAKDFVFANQNNSNTPNANNSNNSSNTNDTNNSNNTNNTSNQNTTLPIPAGIKATASSTRAPYKDIPYSPSFIIDGNLSTAWIEGGSGEGIGEWLRCDFGKTVTLKKIIVYPGYFKSESIWAKNNRVAAATFYFSDGSSIEFDFEDVMKPQTIDVGKIKTSYVKLVIDDVFVGESDVEDTAISEISFVFE